MTRRLTAVALATVMAIGLAACGDSGSRDDSGAVTDLSEVGPDVARLRQEVENLRLEVRSLREELAAAGISIDDPAPELLVDPTETTTSRPG